MNHTKTARIIRDVQQLSDNQPKLTHAEIAELLNVSTATIGRMLGELDPKNPRVRYRQSTLQRIAYALAPKAHSKQETGPAAPPRNDSPEPATHVAPHAIVAENAPQEPQQHTSLHDISVVGLTDDVVICAENREEDRAGVPQEVRALTNQQRHELRRDINRALGERQLRPRQLEQARTARDIALQACKLANEDVAELKKTIGELRVRELELWKENNNLRRALFDALRSSLNATTTNPQGE